jgi:putative Mn2+ efflux pump MntP
MSMADMLTIVAGSLVLSILHALIPNHWLPVLAISRKENWTLGQTTFVTFVSGLSHALSTVFIGLIIGLVGVKLANNVEDFTHFVAPVILISLGIFYIYQHYRHKHFHMHLEVKTVLKNKIILTLVIAMFFSPCLEIEAYFLMAGAHGWTQMFLLAVLYTVVTVSGMVVWIRMAYKGVLKINWHALEHNAGIITGVTLVITGIISFIFH